MHPSLTQIDFNDTHLAFQAQSDGRLWRRYWLMRMIDSPFLTRVGPKIMMFGLRVGLPIKGLIRNTIFDLFVGGESLEGTIQRSDFLYQFGVQTILDYSVEGEKTEAGFDATRDEIIDTLIHGGQQAAVALSACKMTGLANFALMAKVQRGDPLSEDEKAAFARAEARLEAICAAAATHRTPVFIDAEESWIQDTIDQWVEQMMARYNQDEVWVYTTVQHYRHDRLAYLQGLIARSEAAGYMPGVKLVRGAYLEKERDRAEKMGYTDPMQPSKEATDADYDAGLRLCMEHIDRMALCAGTHNEASSRLLTELMALKGLASGDKRIWFAQLLGMSDHISFNLAHRGYNVAKYLPYGPVKAVMPYLIRRANENTAIAGQSSREVELLRKEMNRRKQA